MRAITALRLSAGAVLLGIWGLAAADNAVIAQSAGVYAGPDDSYPLVAQLDADTPIQVMGCLDDWSWCDVRFPGDRGWVYAPDISYGYEGGYVPFYSYAPSFGVPVVAFSVDSYWGSYYHNRPWYAQRADWDSRGPPHHRRPSGPAPSAGPPPREARSDRPGPESHGDHPIRLGSGQPPPRRDEGRADERDHGGAAAAGPRPQDHTPAPRVETRANPPAERTPPEHAPPARDTEHARPAPPEQHESAPRREEKPPANAPPKKDERDRPGPGNNFE
jgi:uncharacterized protein YraI